MEDAKIAVVESRVQELTKAGLFSSSLLPLIIVIVVSIMLITIMLIIIVMLSKPVIIILVVVLAAAVAVARYLEAMFWLLTRCSEAMRCAPHSMP